LPIITKPTRIFKTSATLIDHIYTNNIPNISHSGIIINDVADHFGIFFISGPKSDSHAHKSINKRIFSKNNISSFNIKLRSIDFTNIMQQECPIESFEKFYTLYKDAFDVCFPIRSIQINKNNFKHEPWMTEALMLNMKEKNKLLKKN